MLCGVQIDHPLGLAGHSDADVPVHALMDALLGAAGAGDIGALFPDTDPAFRDARVWSCCGVWWNDCARTAGASATPTSPSSANSRGWPATGSVMRANLAAALGVAREAVSVKGTTTEGMGFEGRGEGISATAVCLLTREG